MDYKLLQPPHCGRLDPSRYTQHTSFLRSFSSSAAVLDSTISPHSHLLPMPATLPFSVLSTNLTRSFRSQLVKPSSLTCRFLSTTMGAPVILCGKTEQIGKGVIATLKPEFDGASL